MPQSEPNATRLTARPRTRPNTTACIEVRRGAHELSGDRAHLYWCDWSYGVGGLVDVVSSAAITVIESKFVNPPDDPQHCPPAVTQALFHDGADQVRSAHGYVQPRPAPRQA
jgi:hypothetical protein